MKYLSIFTLFIFINFTALPSLAVLFDWDIPTLSNNISEEEVNNNIANFNEKLPPKPYKINDYFIQSINLVDRKPIYIERSVSIHLSPYISIFSPPPEVLI